MTEHPAPPAPLFFEPGASWLWVLAGPAAAAAMLWIQVSSGNGYQPLVPLTFLVAVSGFLAVQVHAARIHSSVELTPQTLRQGTETLAVADIVGVYPPAETTVSALGSRTKPQKWQSARTLGELSGVPRGRTAIGLRLTGSRNVQAWARNDRGLRAALATLVPAYTGSPDTVIAEDTGPEGPETTDGPGAPW